jgi:DNA-binding NtrC family response regulator
MRSSTQTDELHPYAAEVLAGEGSAVSRLRLQVARIAPYYRVALLTGESGVGKETVAREMHRLSPMAQAQFSAIDAVDFGIAAARHGNRTIYLRGVDAVETSAQESLLRVLRALDRETRLIVASRSDLKGMVSAGRMRADLCETIAALDIRVPPLRERMEEFDQLAHALVERSAPGATFHEDALARMRQHGWPGNLEELWELCRTVAQPQMSISTASLPQLATPDTKAPARLEAVVQRHVMDVLQICAGNKVRAAEMLGISRSTLYRMLEAAAT